MCEYCEKDKVILAFKDLDDLPIKLGLTITPATSDYDDNIVFIDRGYLRLAIADDCQCMDHGIKSKINYCPFCGKELNEDAPSQE